MNTEPNLLPFRSIQYVGARPGPRFIVMGAVHGNETCGTRAIERLMGELDRGELRIAQGTLTLVPVCNAKAYAHGRRIGDRNLNRALIPTDKPVQFEDHVANWLCPLLRAHELLLDLHSFHSPGQPFVMVGPHNNQGALEPFAHAAREEALARSLGVSRAVDGWLDTYARGVHRRRERADPALAETLDLNPLYGVGTTEYMRSQGGCALTLECGQHEDANAPEVGYRAIRNALAHLGLTDEPAPPTLREMETLTLVDVFDKRDPQDRFAREWRSFDPIGAGELIGTHADGTPATAPADGWIVFPNARADARQEWYYFATASQRLA